jgi:hypothetical protein
MKEIVEMLLQTISDINNLSYVNISSEEMNTSTRIFNNTNNGIDHNLVKNEITSKDIKLIIEQLNIIIQKTLFNPLNISFQNESELIINLLKNLSQLKDISSFDIGNDKFEKESDKFLLTSDMR